MRRLQHLVGLLGFAVVVAACLTAPTSFPCAKDGACPSGFDCLKGTCTQQLACGSVQSNEANCGACGNVCPGSVPCIAGECQCPEGRTMCNDACVDTRKDPKSCGRCARACAAGEVCDDGTCSCAPENVCAGACTDRMTDAQNCGKCGRRCPDSTACVKGSCVTCEDGELACDDGRCVPSDEDNCGQCGRACPVGTTCDDGECTCGEPDDGLIACASGCVDPKRDAKNCGGCGKTCATGERCTGGACATILEEQPELVADLAHDATHLFTVTPDRIVYIPIVAGEPFYELTLAGVTRLAVEGSSFVYVQGSVLKTIPTAGGTATTLANAGVVPALDVDAVSVAFIAGSRVFRVARATPGLTSPIGSGAQPAHVEIGSSHVWWADRFTGRLFRATQSSQQVSTGVAGPFALSATKIYIAKQGGAIVQAPLPAGSPSSALVSAADAPAVAKLRVDATHVYWTAPSRFGLWRAPLAGGKVTTLFDEPGAAPVDDFILHEQNVYFRTSTRVYQLPK